MSPFSMILDESVILKDKAGNIGRRDLRTRLCITGPQVVFICIVLFGSALRIYWAMHHFTHYDDIGLINCLIDDKANRRPFLHILEYGWTYGFLQLIASRLLVRADASYLTNLFLGRLPSLIAGVSCIFLIFHVCRNYVFHKNRSGNWLSLFITGILAASWENIIYSVQAEPYEIGVLFVLVLIIVCYRSQTRPNSREKLPAILVFLAVLAAYIQYTLVIPVAALYLSLFLFSEKKERCGILVSGLSALFFLLYYILSMVSRQMLERGTNWNIGISGRFLFQLPETGAAGRAAYIINFYLKNTFCLIRNFFVSNQFNALVYILAFIFLAFCLAGLIYVHQRERKIGIFLDFNMAGYLLFVCAGKISLGPSRHSLILYPIILLLFAYGLRWAADSGKRCLRAGLVCLAVLLGVVWFQSALVEWKLRRDTLISSEYNSYLGKYQPRYIVAYQNTVGYLLPCTDGYEREIGNWDRFNVFYNKDAGNSYAMFVARDLDLADSIINEVNQLPSFLERGVILSGNVIDSYKKDYGAEIEYAGSYYANGRNGLRIYIVQ